MKGKYSELLLKSIAAGFAGENEIGQTDPDGWLPYLSFEELIKVHNYELRYIRSRINNEIGRNFARQSLRKNVE